VRSIVRSAETTAHETAAVMGRALGLDVVLVPELGEMDRSATGYLAEVNSSTMLFSCSHSWINP
jgi:hypothetical protein